MFFCKRWAPFFEIKQSWHQFFPEFQRFFPEFGQIKTFGGALAPLVPPPPTPLLQSHVIV